MALLVSIDITAGNRMQRITAFEIKRMEPLINPQRPDDETHQYRVTRIDEGDRAFFSHRYGDGAEKCVELAMKAINTPEPVMHIPTLDAIETGE